MGVLDSVIRYKAMEDAKRQRDVSAITQGVESFIKGRQQAQLMEVTLAGKGLRREGGRIVRDPSLISPLEQIIQQGQVSDALLKMQEAKEVGLLGGFGGGMLADGGLRELPTKTDIEIAEADRVMPGTYGEAKGESQFITTQIKAGTRTIKNIGAALEERKRGKAVDVQFREAQEAVKGNRNFLRTVALFSGLVAQIKGKREEQAGELGLAPGIKGAFMAKIRRPGYGRVAAFAGQRRETSFALNSILTGQNRVIRGVIHMILETLPDHFDPEDMAAAKMTQSITNAYKLTTAFRKGILNVKDIENLNKDELRLRLDEKITLTSQEQSVLDSIINEILATPSTKPTKLLEKEMPTGIPGIGETFQGQKVRSIRRIK